MHIVQRTYHTFYFWFQLLQCLDTEMVVVVMRQKKIVNRGKRVEVVLMLEFELRLYQTHSGYVIKYRVHQEREVVCLKQHRTVTKPDEFLVLETAVIVDDVFYRSFWAKLFRK